MTNEIKAALVTALLGHEGEVLRVYDDETGKTLNQGDTIKGFATIGVGRNLMGRGITVAESRMLLSNDIDAVVSDLDRLYPAWQKFSPARQAALMELTFNMGVARFLKGWPNTVAAMTNGQWDVVAKGLLGSLWRKQVGETRAQYIVKLMLSGEFR